MDAQSILLGLLMQKSMTGYEMNKAFSISFSFFSGLSYGSIYPALKKMERRGLITMELEIQDGAPNRKVYTITEAGRQAFLEAVKAPPAPERYKAAFLMRLFFFDYLSPEERMAIAGEYLGSVQATHQALESARPEIEAHADPFQYLCFRFGLRFFQDLKRNVAETIQALDELGSEPKVRRNKNETPGTNRQKREG